jgi:hypothetical protein
MWNYTVFEFCLFGINAANNYIYRTNKFMYAFFVLSGETNPSNSAFGITIS